MVFVLGTVTYGTVLNSKNKHLFFFMCFGVRIYFLYVRSKCVFTCLTRFMAEAGEHSANLFLCLLGYTGRLYL